MITIVIPAYNHQNYVADAIQSALDQTVKCEIICVNDGSQDATLEVMLRFGGEIQIIDQNNKGLPSARNTGIMNATGDYILPLDSDDMLLDNCIEKILKVIEETGADVVAPSFKEFGERQTDIILMQNPTIADFKIANRI